ncbi:hypothetical protein HQ520_08630 [bacterium]|nr:hypothetical protein [bacterium]
MKLWKIRVFFHQSLSKVIGLALIVGIIVGLYLLRGPIQFIWNSMVAAMNP